MSNLVKSKIFIGLGFFFIRAVNISFSILLYTLKDTADGGGANEHFDYPPSHLTMSLYVHDAAYNIYIYKKIIIIIGTTTCVHTHSCRNCWLLTRNDTAAVFDVQTSLSLRAAAQVPRPFISNVELCLLWWAGCGWRCVGDAKNEGKKINHIVP